jgi:AAA+ ATPase superfamily predicted ATPase
MAENEARENMMKYRKPVRIFEDAGIVNPKKAYYIQLENVTNTRKHDIKTMVDQGRYFSIFAPRQSGKTTFLKRFCQELEKDRTYVAILLSFEKYSKLGKEEFYAQVQKALYGQLIDRLTLLDCEKLDEIVSFLNRHRLTHHISFGELFEELNRIIQLKKIVVFIDEFDGIPQEELGDFLATIRSLYLEYKEVNQKALYSVGLIGIRNITKLVVGGVSPFNIADQVDLPSFSLKNVEDLFAQYTDETNQPFTAGALKKIYEETSGQPWLVNRLGTILTVDVKPETVSPIEERNVEKALSILLLENNHHFDNLYEKAKLYKETFVKIVFNNTNYKPSDEDQSWLEQYGLIKKKEGKAVVANNIYKKRFIEVFFDEAEVLEGVSPSKYVLAGGI